VYVLLLLTVILMRQHSMKLVKKHCFFLYCVKSVISQTETCQFALSLGLLLVNLGSIKTLSKNRLRPLPLNFNS